LNGEVVKLQVFCLRSMYSGAAFHRAYVRATQAAFLDAHVRALEMFGGVFQTLRYDNLARAQRVDAQHDPAAASHSFLRPATAALRNRNGSGMRLLRCRHGTASAQAGNTERTYCGSVDRIGGGFERALPALDIYDQLLAVSVTEVRQ
jgi:transposase